MLLADVEQIVADWLSATVLADSGDRVLVVVGGPQQQPRPRRNVTQSARMVTVERIGSSAGDAQPTMDVADVQIDCFARNRERAKQLAYRVHVGMWYQFEAYTHPGTGAFVTQVRVVGAPAQAPWEAETSARYTATYRVWVHHAPAL